MAIIFNGNEIINLIMNVKNIDTGYFNNNEIFSSGKLVTYIVDSGKQYQELIKKGASCLSPKTFTPSKSGWTFAGWREDKTANGSVLTNKVMGDSPVTLYAVFAKNIRVNFTSGYDGSDNNQQVYPAYHNAAGNDKWPTITFPAPVNVNGWTTRGWSQYWDGKADAAVKYQQGSTLTINDNDGITFYGLYQKTVSLRYDGGGATGGSTATQYGTVYNSACKKSKGATITISGCGYSRNGYNFNGWSYTNQILQPGAQITITDSTYATATWTAISFYAIQNGKLVQCPNASAWHGGYNCGSGEVSDGGTNFYGGAGHTVGDVDQSWGADTGNIDTKGCANVQIDGYVNIWGSKTFGASLQVWGNGQLILDTFEANAIKNINISAYSTVRIRINAGISWTDDKDAWVNVGFKNIRFYT